MKSENRERPSHTKDNILGVLETLFRYKKEIIYTCLAAAVLSIIISLLLPTYYKATTSFYAASTDLASPERIFGESSVPMNYYGKSEDIDRIITIAESSEVTDYMIDTFNLYEKYDINPQSELGAFYVRLAFFDMYNLQQTKYDAVRLSVEDKDPETAAAMANAARNKTSQILRRLIKESQYETLKTYERNITGNEKNILTLNDSLRVVRDRYQVYNTESQSEGIAAALQKARSKLLLNQIELEEMQKEGRLKRDSLIKRNAIIAATTAQIEELGKNLDLFNQGMAGVMSLEALQRQSNRELSQDKERYAKLLSAYNSYFPTMHIIEEADVPIIKSRPIRWLIVAGSVAAAFIFSVLGVLLFEQYKDTDWRRIVNAK